MALTREEAEVAMTCAWSYPAGVGRDSWVSRPWQGSSDQLSAIDPDHLREFG